MESSQHPVSSGEIGFVESQVLFVEEHLNGSKKAETEIKKGQ